MDAHNEWFRVTGICRYHTRLFRWHGRWPAYEVALLIEFEPAPTTLGILMNARGIALLRAIGWHRKWQYPAIILFGLAKFLALLNHRHKTPPALKHGVQDGGAVMLSRGEQGAILEAH